MKKLKEAWRRKNSTQKRETVFRFLKQAIFAIVWMLIGSVVSIRVIRVLAFIAVPIIFTFLGYYLGKKSNQETKKASKPINVINTSTQNKR